MLQPCLSQKPSQYFLCGKVLPCDLCSMRTGAVVVSLNQAHGVGSLFDSVEGVEAGAKWKYVTETCILLHDRSASREVARSAIAEPATPQADVHVFCYRELSPRASHIVTVPPRIDRDGERAMSVGTCSC